MTPDLVGLIRVLSAGGVRYIIVGGVAAGVHGALRPTLDLDASTRAMPTTWRVSWRRWFPVNRT
jgi:hypothetical protein